MGTAASTAIGSFTREQVAAKTQNTREMLDFIFHYLMEDIHIRDFYRLSSPDECRRYILILANRIHENFLSLDIVPSRTKTGKLYYRSVHDHVSPPTEAEKTERQTLCVVLAFFYVRIFQIFGALALTLVDDATAMPRVARGVARAFETGAAAAARPAVGRVGDVPVPFRGRPGGRLIGGAGVPHVGVAGVPQERGAGVPHVGVAGVPQERGAGVPQEGGAGPSLGLFNFVPLRAADRGPEDGPDGRKYYAIDTRDYTMGIEAPLGLLARLPNTARLLVYLRRAATVGGKKVPYAILTMTITQKTGIGAQLSFENSITLPGVAVSRAGDFKTHMGTATLEREAGRSVATLDGVTYSSDEIGRMFDVFGERLETYLRGQGEKREERREEAGIYDRPERTRTGLPVPLLADEKVPMGMRMSSLHYALTVTRPLPTCISRAIQLLTTMPSGGMGPALTSVCDRGFLVEDSNKLRSGAPRPGDSIETSPGEMALVQLFYDTVSKATRDSLEQSPGALKDYTTFMTVMARVYGATSTATTLRPSDIKDKAMQMVCSKLMEGKEAGALAIPDTVARSLLPYVQQLFQQQLAHATAAGKVLSKLFSIETRGGVRQIRLNPKLLDGGFPALEVITAEARQLLTAYYSRCEETYREGVKTLYKGLAPAAPAAVAAAAPPAAAPKKGALSEGAAAALRMAAPTEREKPAAIELRAPAAAAGTVAPAGAAAAPAAKAAAAPKRMTKQMIKDAEEAAVLADLKSRYPPLTAEQRARLTSGDAIRYNGLAMNTEEFKEKYLKGGPPAPVPPPSRPTIAGVPALAPVAPKTPGETVKQVVIQEKKSRR